METEKLITSLELADKMQVTKTTISNWVKDGCPYVTKLPLRFLWSEVQKWLSVRER